jgi:Domain of unknown function (DUF3303)
MIYVWLANWKPGLSREQMDGALMRRAAWSYPDGINVLGEYWLGGHRPAVISIFETDDFSTIMELAFTWQDVFEIACEPACTPEQGLQWGPSILERRSD